MNCPYSKLYESYSHLLLDEINRQEECLSSCPIDHALIDDAIRDLICELYGCTCLNVDKIKQCLAVICQQYQIDYDSTASLYLKRDNQEKKNQMYSYMVGYTRAYAEILTQGNA